VGTGSEPRAAAGSWWLYSAFWLSFLAINVVAFVANGIPAGEGIRIALNTVLPDALLGIAVLRLPGLVAWPEGKRPGFYATLFLILLGLLAVSTALWCLLVGLDALIHDGIFRIRVSMRAVPWRLMMSALSYGALAGISYAWHNAAAARAQAERAARAETLRARAELAAMRSQLNPHFIFNTLHALLGLVRREPAVAEEAIERLGDLLRYGLRVHREGMDQVPLREEWEFVESYLALERMRLGDRLILAVDIADSCRACTLPSFSLQTLAENSIRHAIEPRASGGRLSIRARCAEGRLRVQILDDGPGFPREAASEAKGLGLRLLRERLAVLYPGDWSLELGAAPEGGASVALEIPCGRMEGKS
jgi:signal transduction histidine kinase